jgi:hypothetical protein
MIIAEGTEVIYKSITGVIAFASDQYVSILFRKGNHKSQDVRIVVYQEDFDNIVFANGK